VDLAIKVPRKARPEVSIWKGKIVIRGLDNGAAVQANQADVDVRQVSGRISSHITSGRQQFAEILDAHLLASTLQGDMAMDWVTGQVLDVWAYTGDLSAERVRFRELSLRTMRGDIRVKAVMVPGGRYQVSSYHGDVEFWFETAVPVRVVTRAAAGRVSLPDDVRQGMVVAQRNEQSFLFEGQGKRFRPANVHLYSRTGDVRVDAVRVLGVRTSW
jgi:hypothetical protein